MEQFLQNNFQTLTILLAIFIVGLGEARIRWAKSHNSKAVALAGAGAPALWEGEGDLRQFIRDEVRDAVRDALSDYFDVSQDGAQKARHKEADPIKVRNAKIRRAYQRQKVKNKAEIARKFGVSAATVRRVLELTIVVLVIGLAIIACSQMSTFAAVSSLPTAEPSNALVETCAVESCQPIYIVRVITVTPSRPAPEPIRTPLPPRPNGIKEVHHEF